jgi:hypothetical protein
VTKTVRGFLKGKYYVIMLFPKERCEGVLPHQLPQLGHGQVQLPVPSELRAKKLIEKSDHAHTLLYIVHK